MAKNVVLEGFRHTWDELAPLQEWGKGEWENVLKASLKKGEQG